MSGMAVIIACALLVGLVALIVLLWAINSGQYEDLDGDAHRILLDDLDDHCAGSWVNTQSRASIPEKAPLPGPAKVQ